MSAGSIWWGQIGNSLRFLEKITNHLESCCSAVLQVPGNIPWREEFYEAVDIRRTAFSGERRLIRLKWDAGSEPGRFVLEKLCSSRVLADYWPGRSYAEYLGSREDITLNDYFVWVTGIHGKSDLAKWTEFVSRYENAASSLEQSAVFVLEYDGVPAEYYGVDRIVYSAEAYDCRVFCLETAAALKNSELPSYQAELALCIGHGEPELCAGLLERGETLLEEPVKTTRSLMPAMPETEIEQAVWKAAVVLLFPVLEQYRSDFIAAHRAELARHLPITNSNGDTIADPFELEIGTIQYIVSSSQMGFTPSEVETVRLCRKIRNRLAHNQTVYYQDIKTLNDMTGFLVL